MPRSRYAICPAFHSRMTMSRRVHSQVPTRALINVSLLIKLLILCAIPHHSMAYCISSFGELSSRISTSPYLTICPGSTIDFSKILIVRNSDVTIQCGEDGTGDGCVLRPGNGYDDRFFTIYERGTGVKFMGITFENAQSSVMYIYQNENESTRATFERCEFRNNQSGKDGSNGVIYATDGDGLVTFSSCFFTGNSAISSIIYSSGSRVEIDGCTFYDNDVTPVVLDHRRDARLEVTNSCFEDNVGSYLVHIESLYDNIRMIWNNNFGASNISRRGCQGVYDGRTKKCTAFDASICAPSAPSSMPTEQPTLSPTTAEPTKSPTRRPTPQPSISKRPSGSPTTIPSPSPTMVPSSTPSTLPSTLPSATPSTAPSTAPTTDPSSTPSIFPTLDPTSTPSVSPTVEPTKMPSAYPINIPSEVPSKKPTVSPSEYLTSIPSTNPTNEWTRVPSVYPTVEPSIKPTVVGNNEDQPKGAFTSGSMRSHGCDALCKTAIFVGVGLITDVIF